MGNSMSHQQGEGAPFLRGGDAGHGRLPPPHTERHAEDDFYEVPPNDFYAARGAQDRSRQPAFDFNDPQIPNPFGRPEPEPRRHDEPAREQPVIGVRYCHSFAAATDC